LHFDEPIGDTSKPTGFAQHYTGTAADLEARLAEHRAAPDPKIIQAVQRKGIGWQLARTWPGGRQRERQLKNQGGARRHCPVCKGSEPQAVAAFRVESRPRWRKPEITGPPRDLDAVLLESVAVRLDQDKAPAFLDAIRTAEREAWAAGADYRQPGYEGRNAVACDISRLAADERGAAAQMERHRQAAVAEGWWPPVPQPREPELEMEAG
jgi:hypothetical protein